jgi:biotin carboxyl carrier protein
MPDHTRAADRSAEVRAVDHSEIARLADALVPALVAKLGSANLGEVEIREGEWRVRVRRPAGVATRRERTYRATLPIVAPQPARSASAADASDPEQAVAISPAVGMFKAGVPVGTRVRAGDRIATVDLLGIALDVVAPIDGTLTEVYPQSGDGVEYGEEIALVEADAPVPEDATQAATDGSGEG